MGREETEAKRARGSAKSKDAGNGAASETRLYQVVARQIAKLIERNIGGPNWRIPSERELAEELGVSRPVIREAVIALEMRGLVEVRGRSGIVVRAGEHFTFDAPVSDIGPGPFELLEARLALESSAAALAAEKATSYDITHLLDCIERMEHETDVQLQHELGDREFHLSIARITGNPLIVSMLSALWEMRDRSPMWHKLLAHMHAQSMRPLWIGDHHAVVAALRMRNPDAAYKAMSRHIRNIIKELLEADEEGRVETSEPVDGSETAPPK
ncbi:MAG TPA: FadR/GntR family transcriptional regulator [Arsenicitalea sp.]|jgi:DNA-binding FadR family transcriptional regulator|nr:FadR/GntR family transcriptional regulator [Arsenicitalea sp.]